MKAVIMAGGQGTRIRSVASDIPKSMIPVLGKPVLEYQIENLAECGITDLILVTGYLGESIREYFGNGSGFGVNITYFNEDCPMGTAGALYYLKENIDGPFLLLMGDLMLSVDFNRFMAAHRVSGSLATLFVHPNSHPYDSDIIVTDEVGRLEDYTEERCGIARGFGPDRTARGISADAAGGADTAGGAAGTAAAAAGGTVGGAAGFSVYQGAAKPVLGVLGKKEERPGYCHNQVNSGIYALSPEALEGVPCPMGRRVDLDKDIIRPLIARGRVSAYSSSEYVKDMGTPDRYDEVSRAVETGLMEHRNLRHRQRCVFLDRDGTINKYKGLISDPGQLELIDGAAEAIRRLNASEYLAVLITNQPVIARGEATFAVYDEVEKALETLLGKEGAYLDGTYFCPHHSDRGFAGEVAALKFKCVCRKPEPGLILKAAARYNIDLDNSYMIGDMTADIALGKRAGVKTIALATGLNLGDGKYAVEPDMRACDLPDAVSMVLGG